MATQEEQELVELAIVGARASSAGWYRVDCPFCLGNTGKKDGKRSLSVSAHTGKYQCWKCSEEGRIDMEFSGEVELPEPPSPDTPMDPPEDFTPLWEDPGLTSQAHKPARAYLVRRLGKERARQLVGEMKIGACLEGKTKNRIVVPMFGKDGTTWVGWVGRDFTGRARLKYVYPPNMVRTLFNWQALFRPAPLNLIVEGVFDAMPHWPYAVACLGKPDKRQVQMMLDSKNPLVIVLDGDAPDEGWALYQQLRFEGRKAGYIKLPPKRDPGVTEHEKLMAAAHEALRNQP